MPCVLRVDQEGHSNYVWSLITLKSGRLASSSRDTTIKIWGTDGSCLITLSGHKQSVLVLCELHDGRIARLQPLIICFIFQWSQRQVYQGLGFRKTTVCGNFT